MDAFELEVLGSVSNDYEAVHTIRGDLERDLVRPVSESELESALLHLVELGLVDAFVFDPSIGNYRKVERTTVPPAQLWFYISPFGLAEYERM